MQKERLDANRISLAQDFNVKLQALKSCYSKITNKNEY